MNKKAGVLKESKTAALIQSISQGSKSINSPFKNLSKPTTIPENKILSPEPKNSPSKPFLSL